MNLHSSLLLQKTYYRVIQCHRSLQKTPKKKIIICCSHRKRRWYAPWKNQCHSYILRNYCRFLILRCLVLISAIPQWELYKIVKAKPLVLLNRHIVHNCQKNKRDFKFRVHASCDFIGILIPCVWLGFEESTIDHFYFHVYSRSHHCHCLHQIPLSYPSLKKTPSLPLPSGWHF